MVEGWSLGRSVKRPIDRRSGARASYPLPFTAIRSTRPVKLAVDRRPATSASLNRSRRPARLSDSTALTDPTRCRHKAPIPLGAEVASWSAARLSGCTFVAGRGGAGRYRADRVRCRNLRRADVGRVCLPRVTVFVLAVLLAGAGPEETHRPPTTTETGLRIRAELDTE